MRVSEVWRVLTLGVMAGLCMTFASGTALSAGDVVAGESKVALCTACHGPDGNSAAADFPVIAGQIPGYIAAQLAAYKSGERPNAVMQGLVATLTEQDMQDIDAYYAQFEARKNSIAEDEVTAAKRGEEIYRRGLNQFAVPACMACHGPAGDGIPARYPKVSGQFKQYLATTLTEFKSGHRVNEEMNTIAFRLSAQQIEDLAIYMQGLD